MHHGGTDLRFRAFADRYQRQAGIRIAQSKQACRIFDGCRAGFDEQRGVERHQSILDAERCAEVSSKRRLLELRA